MKTGVHLAANFAERVWPERCKSTQHPAATEAAAHQSTTTIPIPQAAMPMASASAFVLSVLEAVREVAAK